MLARSRQIRIYFSVVSRAQADLFIPLCRILSFDEQLQKQGGKKKYQSYAKRIALQNACNCT